MSQALSRALARCMLERRGALPPEARARARLHIADCVGIALAATATPGPAQQVLAALQAGSAGGACRVFGSARGETPAAAAFVNAALIHVLDFDDIHDAARLHPTTLSLPAALAAAQLTGASTARVVEAVALGDELMCRLGILCSPTGAGPGSDWFLTQLFGYFGAALAAGIVLDLDEDALVSAFGLAYMQAAGGKQAGFGTGANARAIYPAFAAMGGVQAALLARARISGPEGALDGAAGLFPIYLGALPSAEQLQLLLDQQGWHFMDTQLKPWPCCRLSHPYVAAALALRAQSGGAEAARVEAAVNASAAKLCRPIEERRRPATLQDAKYSVPWMIAFTLVHGRVDLTTLNEASLTEPEVLQLAQRVDIIENLADRPGHPPARIRFEAVDGRSWESPPDITVENLDVDAASRKFAACLTHAGMGGACVESMWGRLMGFEEQPGAGFLFAGADGAAGVAPQIR